MDGYAVIEKTADRGGNSGRVYVPKSWIGRRVRVVLVEGGASDDKTMTAMADGNGCKTETEKRRQNNEDPKRKKPGRRTRTR